MTGALEGCDVTGVLDGVLLGEREGLVVVGAFEG